MNRLDPQELRDRLFAERAWSKKPLGQHFLIDGTVLDSIMMAAELTSTDVVIEIGPGMGVLTERLVEKTQHVIAFEIDEQMQHIIASDFSQVNLVRGDVLQEAAAVVSELTTYKVVANIPYQITTPLIKLFLEGGVSLLPDRLVLLVQKEVGERLAAQPATSARGYLSVLAQYYADVTYVETVPRTSFWPSPTVDSAVICFQIKPERPFSSKNEVDFLRYVKAAYNQPRKQLKNVLAGIRGVETAIIATQFKELGLAENARAQELSQSQWEQLFTQKI